MVVITLWTTWFNGFKSEMVLYILLDYMDDFFYVFGWKWMDDLFMNVVGNEHVNVMGSKWKEH